MKAGQKAILLLLYLLPLFQAKEYLVISELTDTASGIPEASSWGDKGIYECTQFIYSTGSGSSNFLGSFSQSSSCKRTISNLPPHWSLSVRCDLLIQQIKQQGSKLSDLIVSLDTESQGYFYPIIIDLCSDTQMDQMIKYYQKNLTTHFGDTVTFSIASKSAQIFFSLRNFYLYVDTCDESCLTCKGPNYDQCVTCPYNSTQIGSQCRCNNGKKTHQFTCVDNCPSGFIQSKLGDFCIIDPCPSYCEECDFDNKVCKKCSSGYYLYEGSCVISCPPSSYLSPPTCVDYSTQLANPGYLIKNRLSSTAFSQSEISGLGIIFTNFYYTQRSYSNTTTIMDVKCGKYHLLGGVGIAGIYSSISITPFKQLAPHWLVRIGVFLLQTTCLVGEYVSLMVDQVEVATTLKDCSNNYHICGTYLYFDNYQTINVNVTHSADELSITFTNNYHTSDSAIYQSFGIRDLFILVDYCSPYCLSCNASGCTHCQDGFILKSRRCVVICDSSCKTCDDVNSTTCLSCNLPLLFQVNSKACVSYCNSNSYLDNTMTTCLNCHSSCETCSNEESSSCLSCTTPYIILFQNRCLLSCPNGYSFNASDNSCNKCQLFSSSGCQSCHSSCFACSPVGISDNSDSCTVCYPSRSYTNGICLCKDSEDIRMTFYECSYQGQAVLDVILSNQTPTITINFGKNLSNLSQFLPLTQSHAVCQMILTTSSINLLGSKSSCQISGKIINITLDETSQVYAGDFLDFIPSVLTFASNPLTKIDIFLNNIVIQDAPKGTKVVFTHSARGDSCLNYSISLSSITGDSQRGIKTITWLLINFDSTNSVDVAIDQEINQVNSQQLTKLVLPKGILPLETEKIISVNYILKNTFAGSDSFTFKLVELTSFTTTITDTIPSPLYLFNSFDVLISYFVRYCDMFGNPTILPASVDIAVSSSQITSVSFTSTNNEQSFFGFTIMEYILQQDTNYDFNIHLQLSNDTSIAIDQVYSFYVANTPLIALINGGNQISDYRKQLVCGSTLRDRNIVSATDDQLIIATWKCLNPVDSSPCQTKSGNSVSFSQGQAISIPQRSFNPYVSIQLVLLATKDSRQASSSIYVSFKEFDLPSVSAKVTVIDPFAQIINIDEEVLVNLEYDSLVNSDILSYSGTLTYQDQNVGIITFDYVSLRFRLWDLYSNFNKAALPLEIRFSIYNPNYFMPSISILQFTLNFPPSDCIFSYTQDTPAQQIALTTVFTFAMTGCQDQDSPIMYQFFFYKSYTEFNQELVVPQVVTRKQITDVQPSSQIKTVLPSGNLVIIGLAIDSKTAVFNSTLNITVNDISLSESAYSHIIQQYLQTDGKTTSQYISQLSILSQDLSLKTNFISANINSQKIKIVSTLKESVSNLPLSSMFSSVADKAVNSLIASGIIYSQTQQQSLLEEMKESLDSPLPPSFSKVQRELKKQQLTDFFTRTNSLTTNSNLNQTKNLSDLQLTLLDKIGDLLNENSLPNEGQFKIQEKQFELKTQVITEKNICGYYRCREEDFFNSSSANSSIQPNIYTLSFQQFKDDPFYQDNSFQNYTDTLRQYTNDTLASYPIIIPKIESNGIAANISQPLSLEYNELSSSAKQSNLTCLSKNASTWNTKNCYHTYSSKLKLFNCICEESQPTTIVDNLEYLILNKNLLTAFSSQGLSNISNWTNFYCYVAFWVLLTETMAFVSLLIKGKVLDQIDMSQKGNLQSSKVSPMIPQKELNPDIKTENAKKSINQKKIRRQRLNDPPTETKTSFPSEVNQEAQIHSSQIEGGVFPMKQNELQAPSLFPSVEIVEKGIDLFNPSLESNKLKESQTSQKDSVSLIIENESSQNRETKENQEQEEKNLQTRINKQQFDLLITFSFTKQVLVFHNFFNIFYIYDPKLSRSFRFALFYVRMIHSLAVSIVYSSQYNQAQMIVLSIFNSIIIAIVLKLMEILSNIRNAGKIISSIFSLAILMFYYYIILSIVSGQDYGESNQAMTSYSIVFLMDLLVVSMVISFLLRYIAGYVLLNWEKFKYWRQIFDFLRLQLILQKTISH